LKSIRVALIGLSALVSPLYAGDKPEDLSKFAYRGFTVDIAAIGRNRAVAPEDYKQALRHQIDMVAELPLQPETLKFFQEVPVVVDFDPAEANPGIYDGKKVVLQVRLYPPERVVLLHELLHAYHAKALPEGVKNPTVIQAYRGALEGYPFKRTEDFFENEKEFFAVTASIYLHGEIPRPPYNPLTIQQIQPAYYQFLAKTFPPAFKAPATKSPAAKSRAKKKAG
jgi:hypothetical protein